MGALWEALPPEFEGLAEYLRVQVKEMLSEAHKAGMSDMADALGATFTAMGLEDLAKVCQVLKQVGLDEVDKIMAERRGR